jgi:acetylornithine aminotransferase/acetylornithine/N-succinyldiaminopimelate aminotransferase
MYVFDKAGKKYLDFGAGIAVNSLGHNHPVLTSAISEQAKKIIHISNLYWNEPQIELAEKLVANTPFDKVFFCNSGAEAVEGLIKISRKFGGGERFEIIAMEKSFHGRTTGSLAATGQTKYQKAFLPLLPGIVHVPLGDAEAIKAAITDKTVAVLLEPVQGESGIHPATVEYLREVRKICDENNLLLMFDEVQCGVGRTGELFACQYFGVTPDAIATAKGLAGGVPIGMIMATKRADVLCAGEHASTFGGNPLATCAANVVIDELLGGILDSVKENGKYLTEKLNALKSRNSKIVDVRGIGFMQGAELTVTAAEVIKKAMENGLLLVGAGEKVVRFTPPLIAQKEHIDEMISILENCI